MCVWGISLLYVTWLSRTPVMETRINLIPFQPDGNAMLFDYITNIVMFIPFPILLYGILQKRLSFMTLSVAGIGLSLAIELLQLLTHRGICDIEDFILNSAGVIIGSLLTLLLMKAEKKN
ncbi:MAG: VanZ family protein [Clostridia bacterium]|jgi:glycopeptide antibiotics resistance protein|nr:VanZ family protein [Clostridia bacterium]